MAATFSMRLFGWLTGAQDGQADPAEARNGLWHVAALTASKLSDGLIDPKLVLSWLLSALGAPAAMIGMLVPVREAGALLPQVFLAKWVRRLKQRRWVWVAGSAGQGVAAALIAVAALTLDGRAAGAAVIGLMALLAVCRAACSVSYQDILGKTIGQRRRGAVTGMAGSISAVGVFCFAGLMVTGVLKTQGVVVAAIALAAVLWALAALALAQLSEEDSALERDDAATGYVQILRQDANLRWFILARGLLVSTALAPPYLVLLQADGGDALRQLGGLVLASSASSFMSSYVWGRLADYSSRLVLLFSGLAAAAAMVAAIAASLAGLAQVFWVIPAILFVLMLAYQGVRQARSIYLVDISPENRRSLNTAAVNAAIGLILLGAGALGGALTWIGPLASLTGFAAMSVLGGLFALRLEQP